MVIPEERDDDPDSGSPAGDFVAAGVPVWKVDDLLTVDEVGEDGLVEAADVAMEKVDDLMVVVEDSLGVDVVLVTVAEDEPLSETNFPSEYSPKELGRA